MVLAICSFAAWRGSCDAPAVRLSRVAERLLLAGCFGFCAAMPRSARAARPAFAYVSANPNQQPGMLSAFRIAGDGQSTPIAGSPFPTDGLGMAPAAGAEFAQRVAVSRSGHRLFAANDGSGTISVFNVDPSSGVLRRVSGSPFAVENWSAFPGISLTVSNDGRFLYASGTTLVSFWVDSNGGLSPIGSQWQLPQRVGGMAVSPSNSRLYLTTPDGVYVLDSGEGGLTTNPPALLSIGSFATDLRLSPTGDRLWVGTRDGGILAYSIASQGISIVPGAPFFSSISNLSGLSADFYGRFVFAYSSVGPRLLGAHSNLNGSLVLAPDAPLSPLFAPTGGALTPDGSFLLLSDAQSRLDAWSTRDDGMLTHLADYPVPSAAAHGSASIVTFPDESPTPAPASPACLTLALATALALLGGRRMQITRG